LALPLFSQSPAPAKKTHTILRFTLQEKPQDIFALLGHPNHVDDSSRSFVSWMWESADGEAHDDDNLPSAYILCLRAGDRHLLSVTRNFDEAQDVDDLFPATNTRSYYWPSKDAPQYSLRLREVDGGNLLLAMGVSRPGQRTTQLILIRRDALPVFMPWLAEQLAPTAQ
jgi:hypothetical protein